MRQQSPTSLTVYTGPMFSGKTERLILALNRFKYANRRIIVGKSAEDTRNENYIATRRIKDGVSTIIDHIPAAPIRNVEDFRALTKGEDYDVLAIDEVQFFALGESRHGNLSWFCHEIRDLLNRRRNSSLQILLAGLDTRSDDTPFGHIGDLLALADHVEKLSAVCMKCHADGATKSHNTAGDPAGLRVGDFGTYEARCRACFEPA